MASKRKVAIFDVDGTIFRSSLLLEIINILIEQGTFSQNVRNEYDEAMRRWLDRRGDYESYIMAAVKSFMTHIRGVHYSELANAAESLTERLGERTYRYTRELLKELKKKRYFLLAISQSPKTVLDPFCEKLGFDKVYGRIYEVGPSSLFTGSIGDLELIANKANVIKRAVEKENLTLKGSIAVGDTEDDMPMLELVETPIAFNPNAELYRHAKRLGWQVVVERKDVIYRL